MSKDQNKYSLRIWLFDNLRSIILGLIGITIGMASLYFQAYQHDTHRDDSYIEKYVSCVKEISNVKAEMSKLRARMLTLELAVVDIPFIYWVKDVNGVIIHISKKYETLILNRLDVDIKDFINTRGEALGEDFVAEISKNDKELLSLEHRDFQEFEETVPGVGLGTSYKFIIRVNNKILGTGGIWIPKTN